MTFKFSILMLLIACLNGCMDLDPFGFSNRDIVGDYYLEKWEDGETFYLHDSKK